MRNTSKRIALITGANKGIGFEIARQIGRTGVTVLVGARNKAMGEEAAAKLAAEAIGAHFVAINVADYASVEAAAGGITSGFGRLDILVNNAGINDPCDGPAPTAQLDAVARVLQTNFLGALAVTQAMLPLLRQSQSARIVNMSSGLGSLTLNGDPAYPSANVKLIGYSASKAALNMLTVQLAYLLRDTAIKVNAADPGYTATDLNGHRGTQTIPEGAAEPSGLHCSPTMAPSEPTPIARASFPGRELSPRYGLTRSELACQSKVTLYPCSVVGVTVSQRTRRSEPAWAGKHGVRFVFVANLRDATDVLS
jgi:NAD(P)-dependent dehydrogenase (short-subunit alcohol dehydrogenase family)